ncbi:hypothetical protein PUN4_1000051 [Paraburkholderia unamae]|nr:hypothetical protein PUN4_1000051 [Paraburkholderia unamae]
MRSSALWGVTSGGRVAGPASLSMGWGAYLGMVSMYLQEENGG